MRKVVGIFLLILVLGYIFSCVNYLVFPLKPQLTEAEARRGTEIVELVKKGTFDEASKKIKVQISEAQFNDLQKRLGIIDVSQPPLPIGKTQIGNRADLHLQYQTTDKKWILGNITIDTDSNDWIGIHFFPLESPIVANGWNFNDRGPFHFIVLICGFLLFLIHSALVYAVYSHPSSKLWIFWVFISLWGAIELRFNWSTGSWAVLPLNINVFSFGILKLPWYGPWTVILAIPVGPLVSLYFLRRNKIASIDVSGTAST